MAQRALDARRFLRFSWLWGFIVMLVVSLAVGVVSYRVVDPYFEGSRAETVIEASATPTIERIDTAERRLSAVEGMDRNTKMEIELLKSAIETMKASRPPVK